MGDCSSIRILIIDDEEDMLSNYSRLLGRLNMKCITCSDPLKVSYIIREENPEIVLTDLKMPEKNGIDLLEEIKEYNDGIIVILFTAYGTIDSAVEAIKKGAFDYLKKPFSFDELKIVINRACEKIKLKQENLRLKRQLREKYKFDKIIGKSEPLQQVLKTVIKAARTEASILLTGESGTGKELVARSIHVNSYRAEKSFVPVDCATLPGNLLESELFGYKKGAFTGADRNKEGLLAQANGGTVFLDEIGELNLDLQAKFLRFLEEGQYRSLGGNETIKVDTRVIAATNRDLKQMIKEGKFREDLFYRLNVINIFLPPLRERPGDILLLINHYFNEFTEKYPTKITGFTDEAIKLLINHCWPGNIRELKNVIERGVILAEGEKIEKQDLPPEINQPNLNNDLFLADMSFKRAKECVIERFERYYLEEILKETENNISKAAVKAGINRRTIYRLLEKHNLNYLKED